MKDLMETCAELGFQVLGFDEEGMFEMKPVEATKNDKRDILDRAEEYLMEFGRDGVPFGGGPSESDNLIEELMEEVIRLREKLGE
jgi:hypothetical protein